MQIMPPPASVQSAADPRFQEKSPQATGVNHSVSESETRAAVAPTSENAAGTATRDAASQKNQHQQKEEPSSKEDVQKAMERLNHAVGLFDTGLLFTTDSSYEDVRVVQVVDRDTKEIIRQIPSEEAIRIAKAIDTFRGLLIREEV